MKETLISESIAPVKGAFTVLPMAIGEPGVPQKFSWRKKQFIVVEILEKWKELGDCKHGSGERYLRKHWYRLRTDSNLEMKIYFERQSRSPARSRWRLYSITETEMLAPACLTANDERFSELVSQVGSCRLEPKSERSPFESLVRAVAHQQLNGKAASCILDRFVALFGNDTFPSPDEVHAMDADQLTKIGFSRAKAGYVKEIAQAALDGVIPSRKDIQQLSDDEIIERFTKIKGVGPWSVQMFLIFGLGRPDVLPIRDYGIQQGFAIVYRKRKLPRPDQILKFGERWRPHRTMAAWYLWRAVDLENERKLQLNSRKT